MPILTWIGKEKVINHHQKVPFKVLNHCYTYNNNGENEDYQSGNKVIHGDNLSALKSLLPQYEGKIQCIYIDPPYNTGNENWVYNDNVNDEKFKSWFGEVVGKDGDDFSRHDKWLCMMYPRLKLMYQLLADSGAIFISIDDNEVTNLRMILDEIFGQKNFIAQISLLCNPKGRSQDKYFATNHEYLLVYAKKELPKGAFDVLKSDEKILKDYKYEDEHGKYRLIELRNTHREFNSQNRKNLWYPVYVSKKDNSISLNKDEFHDIEVYPYWNDGYSGCWTWGKELAERDIHLLTGKLVNNQWKIYRKSYAYSNKGVPKQKLFTIWNDKRFYTEKGQILFSSIFPNTNKNDFPQPKSMYYIKEIIRTITDKDSIILDSFAGSGTTGHAVIDLNKEDGGNRKFILIEMEDYAESITAERMKRVITGYGNNEKRVEGINSDFSYYELGEALLKDGNINENIELQKIKEYIYFLETGQPYIEQNHEYYLGSFMDSAYYFYFEKNNYTTLDYKFLETINIRKMNYIIYADRCVLTKIELEKYHIIFKKIPRDIVKV